MHSEYTKHARVTSEQGIKINALPSTYQTFVVFGRFAVLTRRVHGRIPNCRLGETGGREVYLGNPSPTSNSNYTELSKKKSSKKLL